MTVQATRATVPETEATVPVVTMPKPAPVVDKALVARLVGEAQAGGVAIDGEGGLLAELTKLVVESALEANSPPIWAMTSTNAPAARGTGMPATAAGPRRC